MDQARSTFTDPAAPPAPRPAEPGLSPQRPQAPELRLADLSLGFVTARPMFVDEHGVWAQAGVCRLVEEFQKHCRRVEVAAGRSPDRGAHLKYRMSCRPADVVAMPYMTSIASSFRKAAGCRRAIRQLESRCDVLVVQMPFAAISALLFPRRPRVYVLTADLSAAASTAPEYRGWRRLPALVAARAMDRVQRRLFHSSHARLVSHGELLRAHYNRPPGRAVVSATLSAADIQSVRRSRPADAPFRVLFVGYFRYMKGIDVLLTAFRAVQERLPAAELELVGSFDDDHRQTHAWIRRQLDEIQAHGVVRLAGEKPFGPDLFQCYADADVLVLPTRSEGTPRVLLEARAFGCPVIATPVGGIPESVEHETDGLLTPVDDPQALAEAILRLAADSELRRRLIAGGLERARRDTVEAYARAIAEEALAAVQSTR